MERTTYDTAAVTLPACYHAGASMPTDVVKRLKLTCIVTNHNNSFPGHLECQVIARLRQIGLMPHQHPLPSKQHFRLKLKQLLTGVGPGCEHAVACELFSHRSLPGEAREPLIRDRYTSFFRRQG